MMKLRLRCEVGSFGRSTARCQSSCGREMDSRRRCRRVRCRQVFASEHQLPKDANGRFDVSRASCTAAASGIQNSVCMGVSPFAE